MSRPTLEVADIVRTSGNRFWEHYGSHLAWQHRKVLDAIAHCRTAALGAHRDQCTDITVPLRCPVCSDPMVIVERMTSRQLYFRSDRILSDLQRCSIDSS